MVLGGNGKHEPVKCKYPRCSRWAVIQPDGTGGFCPDHHDQLEEFAACLGFLLVDGVPLTAVLRAGAAALKRQALVIPSPNLYVPKKDGS